MAALSDVTQHTSGAKRRKSPRTSIAAADDDLPPPAKRMATAAGQATHQSSATAAPAASVVAPGSSRFGFGFKAPASFTKTAMLVESGVVAVENAATAPGSNQSEHEAPRGDVEIKVESAATAAEVRLACVGARARSSVVLCGNADANDALWTILLCIPRSREDADSSRWPRKRSLVQWHARRRIRT